MLTKILKAKDCKKCKQCCQFFLNEDWDIPFFTEYEMILRKFSADTNIVYFHSRLWKINILGLNNTNTTACPFLDKNKGCMLKESKPFECRIWPFILMKSEENKPLIALSKDCSIINKYNKNVLIAIALENKEELFKVAYEYPEILKHYNDNYELIIEID